MDEINARVYTVLLRISKNFFQQFYLKRVLPLILRELEECGHKIFSFGGGGAVS